MSAKKKNQQTALPENLKSLWQKYSLYICGGLLVLLLLFSFLLWYKTVHTPAAVSDTIRQNVQKFATGDGSAVFEILTVTDRNAILKMEAPELDLEDVILSYPEGSDARKIDGISIGRVRIKGDFRTACRKLLDLRKRRYLQLAGNVTIREIVYGEQTFRDLVMSLDTFKGTLDGSTEIAYDPEKNQLHLKNNVFFVPEMFFTEAEWKLIPHFMYFFRLPSGEDSFRAQELVMDLTETVHPFKRIVKLQAENLVDSYHLDADPVSRWADSIRYDAQTGALEVIFYDEHPRRSGVKKTERKPHTILNATLNADDGVTFREKDFDTQDGRVEYRYEGKIDKTGKVDAKGRTYLKLGGVPAQEGIREFGDGTSKETYKQYAFSTPDFTARIPEVVVTYSPGSNDYSFKNAELTFHGIPFTAKDIFADWNYHGNGTFSIGTVCENGRKIGSISAGKRDLNGFTGKAHLYGLDGTLNGKLFPVPVQQARYWEAWKWEYTLTFPRQQIKNAGRDLLPANSPVRLQGFASLKMDHKGLFDLVIDNGELDLSPVKLSNFSLSTGTQTFAFDGIDFCGIKFGKGQGKYHLENGKIHLDGVTFDWCGGKGKLLPQLESGSYLLDCSDLLLSELFKALEIGVFEGAGRVSGRIPLSIMEDGVLTLGKMAFYSVPGGSETLKGTLHENFSSGDPAYTFVADVMRNMKYDWVRLDMDPVPENGKYTLRISFRGKPGQPLNYELAPGADGSAMIRKSETARNFGYLNLSLNLSLNLDPEKFRNAVRHLSR